MLRRVLLIVSVAGLVGTTVACPLSAWWAVGHNGPFWVTGVGAGYVWLSVYDSQSHRGPWDVGPGWFLVHIPEEWPLVLPLVDRSGTVTHMGLPLWALGGLFALSYWALVRPMMMADRRRRRGLCPRCGYDLRGSPEKCPECGTVPMISAAHPSAHHRSH
jgi:hypothetical protein